MFFFIWFMSLGENYEHMLATIISGASWNSKYIPCVGHRQDLPLYPSMRLLPHPNQTPPPPTPTKPLLIPDVANWLTFCCTSPGGANKKFKIPDIHLNVYTLTIIILYDFQVENYKKWPFLVVDFFSSSANFFHTERAEPFCQELAVLNKPK